MTISRIPVCFSGLLVSRRRQNTHWTTNQITAWPLTNTSTRSILICIFKLPPKLVVRELRMRNWFAVAPPHGSAQLKSLFASNRGMVKEATVFYKKLASCLAAKWDQSYSATMSQLASMLTYLLSSSISWIQCIRVGGSLQHSVMQPSPWLHLWTWIGYFRGKLYLKHNYYKLLVLLYLLSLFSPHRLLQFLLLHYCA